MYDNNNSISSLGFLNCIRGIQRNGENKRKAFILLIIFSVCFILVQLGHILLSFILAIATFIIFIPKVISEFKPMKAKDCICIYSDGKLTVDVANGKTLVCTDIIKLEYSKNTDILYIFCKESNKLSVVTFGVYDESSVKDFSKLTDYVVSYV